MVRLGRLLALAAALVLGVGGATHCAHAASAGGASAAADHAVRHAAHNALAAPAAHDHASQDDAGDVGDATASAAGQGALCPMLCCMAVPAERAAPTRAAFQTARLLPPAFPLEDVTRAPPLPPPRA